MFVLRQSFYSLFVLKVIIVLLTIFFMLYILVIYLFYNCKFVPLNTLHLFCPVLLSLLSDNCQFIPCICEYLFILFSLFRYHTYVRSYEIYPFLSNLFHLAQCPLDPSMLLQMARFYSSLWLKKFFFSFR